MKRKHRDRAGAALRGGRQRTDQRTDQRTESTARRRGPPPTLWLFGVHAVMAALANGRRRCRRLLVAGETRAALKPRLAALAAARPGLPGPETATRAAIAAMLPAGAVHQGIALEVEPLPAATLADTLSACAARPAALLPAALLVVLDRVTDPHNVGAVLRSAAAFGADGVIVTERHAPGETGVLAKAASGGLEAVPLVRVTNLARALKALRESGFWCVGLDTAAGDSLAGARLEGRVALVLGAEGKGLRRLTREACDLLLRLPITGTVESLNVSAAAAIALYELRRGGTPAP